MKNANLHNAECVSTSKDNFSILVRKKICVHDVCKAELTIASFGFFYGYINGKKISDDMFVPLSTDFNERKGMIIQKIPFDEETGHRLYCPVYDVTELLCDGDNALCFTVGSGWYGHVDGETIRYGKIKISYCLEITHNDGSVSHIVSDESDKVSEGFAKSGELLYGEVHDYTDYDDAWVSVDFDDSAWENAAIEEMPETNLYVQDCPSDRVVRRITPKKILERENSAIYDVGEIISGYPVFSLESGAGVNIRYGELINDDNSLKESNIYGQLTSVKAGNKPRTVDTQFTWYCFRYFEVFGKCEIGDCLVIHTDVEVNSSFVSDDETLNWLYDAFIRTQLANMHCGIPSDCPHAERKGYTGDGQLTCRAVMSFIDAKKFYRKWIRDISDCQDRKTGHVQYTAPYIWAGGGPGGWGGAMVLVPYYYYKRYGETEVLREMYPQMIRYFDYLEAHSENDLVVSDRENGWCLGDWCTPDQMVLNATDGMKVPPPLVNTYFYIKAMQMVIEIEKVIGIDQNTALLEERIKNKKAAMTEAYFDSKTGDFCENQQGSNAFAVDINLGDERTFENMVENYKKLGRYDTGIFGTELVTRLMFEKGRPDIALSLLTSKSEISFYNQRKTGATTILENWNGVRSQCHPMFGAVSACLAEYVLGIRQTTAGYEDVVIDPICMDMIKTASGHITTEKGVIAVEYNEKELHVTVPKAIKCKVAECDRKVYVNYTEPVNK